MANAVAALSEISESHPNSNLLDLNPQNINKLLTALNECTEWGQIFILDCLSNYNPKDEREAQRYLSLRGRFLSSFCRVFWESGRFLSCSVDQPESAYRFIVVNQLIVTGVKHFSDSKESLS